MTTLAQALRAATERLAAAGVDSPARDARVLAAHVLGLAPDALIFEGGRELDAPEVSALEKAVAARARRQPVSQITGRRLFWGRSFRVTPDVLDPRPETEILVGQALSGPLARVLDLGTGTGCILLTLLAERPEATGLGLDLSPAALDVARANAATLGLEGRARCAASDWYQAAEGPFDLIVSNPPYIAADEMAQLSPEVRDWEPDLALTPGGDGLDAYRAIAAGAPAHLSPGGRLMVEIGPTQAQAVAALFSAAGLTDIVVTQDLDGRDRVVSAVKR